MEEGAWGLGATVALPVRPGPVRKGGSRVGR